MSEVEYMGRMELMREVERLRALLRDVADSGVAFEDPRIHYVEVQIDTVTWQEIRDAVGGAAA
jgi:hypothetical protein